MDISARARGYSGMWKRVPIGPCSFISPFNFPLNLAAHKVAPAIAVGCPFVLKPASLTPIGALIIGEILAETDLPEGAFSILPCRREGAAQFTEDERLKLLSFTGSPEVGWDLKARAGKMKVVFHWKQRKNVQLILSAWHDEGQRKCHVDLNRSIADGDETATASVVPVGPTISPLRSAQSIRVEPAEERHTVA